MTNAALSSIFLDLRARACDAGNAPNRPLPAGEVLGAFRKALQRTILPQIISLSRADGASIVVEASAKRCTTLLSMPQNLACGGAGDALDRDDLPALEAAISTFATGGETSLVLGLPDDAPGAGTRDISGASDQGTSNQATSDQDTRDHDTLGHDTLDHSTWDHDRAQTFFEAQTGRARAFLSKDIHVDIPENSSISEKWLMDILNTAKSDEPTYSAGFYAVDGDTPFGLGVIRRGHAVVAVVAETERGIGLLESEICRAGEEG